MNSLMYTWHSDPVHQYLGIIIITIRVSSSINPLSHTVILSLPQKGVWEIPWGCLEEIIQDQGFYILSFFNALPEILYEMYDFVFLSFWKGLFLVFIDSLTQKLYHGVPCRVVSNQDDYSEFNFYEKSSRTHLIFSLTPPPPIFYSFFCQSIHSLVHHSFIHSFIHSFMIHGNHAWLFPKHAWSKNPAYVTMYVLWSVTNSII